MTVAEAIVLLGPNGIRGPGSVDEVLASVALECIDDRLALVDDRAVPVERVWRRLMCSVVGAATTVVLVPPDWWPSRRTSLVVGALPESCANVVVLHRPDLLRTDDASIVVEIADDFVMLNAWQVAISAVPRGDRARDVCVAVVDRIAGSATVVIDVPSGVAGARFLAEELAVTLRTRGIPVSIADDDTVLRVVRAARSPRQRRFCRPRSAAVAASVLSVVLLACASAVGGDDPAPHDSVWAVEGHVAVEVPVNWTIERVTVGPGSARLQVVSPSDPQAAIHLTQSPVPMQQSLKTAGEVLRKALDSQPVGVFEAFKTTDRRAGRPVISYQEVRASRRVDWTVLLDSGVRIAIGCQRASDRPLPEGICDRAIRSARVLA